MRASQYLRETSLPYANCLRAFDDPSAYLDRIKGEIASVGSFSAGVGCDDPWGGGEFYPHKNSDLHTLPVGSVKRASLAKNRELLSVRPSAVQRAFERIREQRQVEKERLAEREWQAAEALRNDAEWQRSRCAHEDLMRRVEMFLAQSKP